MNILFKNEVVEYNFFNTDCEDTILFLHGWGGNKFSFQSTINLLKNQFNILSVTMPTTEPTISVWNMFDYVALIDNLLGLTNAKNLIIICHSFGFRVAMLLNKKINIKKIIVTSGAGLKKENIFKKIMLNYNKIMLKHANFNIFYKKIANNDYLSLSKTNKETFKNIVNLNLKFALKFNCPMLLFWGTKDTSTKPWIAKQIKRKNNAKLLAVKDDHFAYISQSNLFNHEVLKFLKSSKENI